MQMSRQARRREAPASFDSPPFGMAYRSKPAAFQPPRLSPRRGELVSVVVKLLRNTLIVGALIVSVGIGERALRNAQLFENWSGPGVSHSLSPCMSPRGLAPPRLALNDKLTNRFRPQNEKLTDRAIAAQSCLIKCGRAPESSRRRRERSRGPGAPLLARSSRWPRQS